MNEHPAILASASPQRTCLLAQLGVAHTAIAANIDESARADESAESLAERLARTKAEALAAAYPDAIIVGSDTVVALERTIYGKPADADEAAAMLGRLAGVTHRVVSGVAVHAQGHTHARVCTSAVTMRALGGAEIAAYVASGEPFGKAGAYASRAWARCSSNAWKAAIRR